MNLKSLAVVSLIVGVVSGACVAVAIFYMPSPEPPALTASYDDIGPIRAGTKINRTLRLHNPYAHTLRITSIKPACSCTTVQEISNLEIAHGATLPIEVEIRVPDTEEGAFRSTVMVLFQDHEPVELGVIGEAIAVVRPEIDFGEVLRGTEPSQEVAIQAFPSKPLEVLSMAADEGLFRLSLVEGLAGRGGATLGISVRADARIGRFVESLELELNDPYETHKEIQLRGRIVGPVSLIPETLAFGVIDLGEEKTLEATLAGRNGLTPNIARLGDPSSPFLSIAAPRLGASDGESVIEFTIRATDESESHVVTEELLISGDLEGIPFHVALTVSALLQSE